MTTPLLLLLTFLLVHFLIRFTVTWRRVLPCAGRLIRMLLSAAIFLIITGGFVITLGPPDKGALALMAGAVIVFLILSTDRRRARRA